MNGLNYSDGMNNMNMGIGMMPNGGMMMGATAPMMGMPPTFTNGGVTFNQPVTARKSYSSDEDMALIKRKTPDTYMLTPEEAAIAKWDFRDGTQIALEVVDPTEDIVRSKYTNEEWKFMTFDDPATIGILTNTIMETVNTVKLLNNGSVPADVTQTMGQAAAILNKGLERAYRSVSKNNDNVFNAVQNQVNMNGYNNYNVGMFNGYSTAPKFFAPISGNPNQMPAEIQNYQAQLTAAYQAGQQNTQQNIMAQMQNMPMGGNPFVQGGQQQVMPTGGTMMGQGVNGYAPAPVNPMVANPMPQPQMQMGFNNPLAAPAPSFTDPTAAAVPQPGVTPGAVPPPPAAPVTAATATI